MKAVRHAICHLEYLFVLNIIAQEDAITRGYRLVLPMSFQSGINDEKPKQMGPAALHVKPDCPRCNMKPLNCPSGYTLDVKDIVQYSPRHRISSLQAYGILQ